MPEATTSVDRAANVFWRLARLKADGVITDWYSQSNMPGRMWTIWGPGWERKLNTHEAEVFCHGLEVGSKA